MPGQPTCVEPCQPADRSSALAVLFRRVPGSLRPRLIANALEEEAQGVIDLSGLWVAWRDGRIVGAMLSQAMAGRTAAVWAPEVSTPWRRGLIAESLVRAALQDYRSRGFLIAQALLDESAPRQGAADLASGGMPHVTDLVYLERETAIPIPVPLHLPPIHWRSFGPDVEVEFRAVLQATYIQSLDMPELEGIRSLDDILASHRAAGRFRPDRWRVGLVEGEPEAGAILLLSEVIDRDAWEVAYLGLTPAARGRGLGTSVLAQAISMAASQNVSHIELAVDTRNHPASHLYQTAQFITFDRRSVHIASLDRFESLER